MKRAEKERGFTLIEVMIALIVFMVGLVGLVALQRASSVGLEKGREHTAAVNIAQYFLTQLRSEIGAWKYDPSSANNNSCVDFFPTQATQFLMLQNGVCNNAAWQLTGGTGFRIDSFLGHSALATNNAASRYCVHYKSEAVDIPPSAVPEDYAKAMVWRARVRVAWPKSGQFANWSDCNQDLFDTGDPPTGRDATSEFVELVTIATREFAQ